MFTLKLSNKQKSWLTVELNLELRHCDPRGYPNNDSYVLQEPYATELNDLFFKLTGHDHESFIKWFRHGNPVERTDSSATTQN